MKRLGREEQRQLSALMRSAQPGRIAKQPLVRRRLPPSPPQRIVPSNCNQTELSLQPPDAAGKRRRQRVWTAGRARWRGEKQENPIICETLGFGFHAGRPGQLQATCYVDDGCQPRQQARR